MHFLRHFASCKTMFSENSHPENVISLNFPLFQQRAHLAFARSPFHDLFNCPAASLAPESEPRVKIIPQSLNYNQPCALAIDFFLSAPPAERSAAQNRFSLGQARKGHPGDFLARKAQRRGKRKGELSIGTARAYKEDGGRKKKTERARERERKREEESRSLIFFRSPVTFHFCPFARNVALREKNVSIISL